jgi:hypothetical protein
MSEHEKTPWDRQREWEAEQKARLGIARPLEETAFLLHECEKINEEQAAEITRLRAAGVTEAMVEAAMAAFVDGLAQGSGGDMRAAITAALSARQAGVTEAEIARARAAYDAAYSAETERAGYRWEACHLAGITAALSARQGEECPHCGKAVSACPCENPAAAYSADMPEAVPDWVRIENEARAKDGRTLHPGPIPRSAYKNNPYADY